MCICQGSATCLCYKLSVNAQSASSCIHQPFFNMLIFIAFCFLAFLTNCQSATFIFLRFVQVLSSLQFMFQSNAAHLSVIDAKHFLFQHSKAQFLSISSFGSISITLQLFQPTSSTSLSSASSCPSFTLQIPAFFQHCSAMHWCSLKFQASNFTCQY